MSQVATEQLLKSDSLLTDRVRLVIAVTLAGAKEPMDFRSLLDALNLTKGNLSSHMRKLEEAGIVHIQKEFIDRKPKTTYTLSNKGREELKAYLDTIENFVRAAENL